MDTVIEKFKSLRLKNCALNLTDVLDQSARNNLSVLQTIDQLLEIELACRKKARITLRFKQSRLGDKTTIDQFDFSHHESRQKQKGRILNLIDLGFIQDKKDIILIGNPGTGKTFLSKCIAYAATQAGIKTLFTTAIDMINQLVAAKADHTLLKKLQYYQSQDILVCDEIGYLPLGRQGSNLFFQVISARHEKKSTIITTNLPFAKWGDIFDGTTVATAIADRLVHNSEILIMEGKSYRKRT
ncbi:MAG: IS21-like element helper ATPase IstB [Deltaproteobacteria bacterium]|nr:IS21-like element helper ATPase IstB [Deltaproteobacteria bacterium]